MVDIRDAFNLLPGGQPGSCAGQINTLNAYFTEIYAMTTAAIRHLSAALGEVPDAPEEEKQGKLAATTWLAATNDDHLRSARSESFT